jgi:hypothetical protein
MCKIYHCALYARECNCDGLHRRTMAAADVDQGADPLEDATALLDGDVHEDHANVEELAHGRVIVEDEK